MKSTGDDHSAGRRAREVYRYFRPEHLAPINENPTFSSDGSPMSEAKKCTDSSSLHHRSPSGSSASPGSWTPATLGRMPDSLALGASNDTLNSFAELAALRLNMDRVFISVSDRDSQYIIAQAAQTKKNNNKYDTLSNGVYEGCSTLRVNSWTPCQDTLALSHPKEQDEYEFLVSNDLTQESRYKDLPFVKGEPNFRFYAGTPLTTESNINVGCFFVLDTKPHAEFSEDDREMMGTMAKLIMDYLMVSRQASEGRRAARLSHGLNYFIEGKSSFMDSTEDWSSTQLEYNTPPSSKSREDKLAFSSHNRSRSSRSPSSNDCSRSPNSTRSTSSATENRDQSLASSVDSNMTPRFPGLSTSNKPVKDDYKGNAWTFQRAANLIRESLELKGDSGVVFIEAGNDPALDIETGSDSGRPSETGKPASILGVSTGDDSFGPSTGTVSNSPIVGIDEIFMHGLLNRYSKGKIWSFHRDGLLSSSDSDDTPRESRARTRNQPSRSKRSKKWKATENKTLNRTFPGATQIIFVPLWNAANSQWFGGCFCWNKVESVVFDPAVELSSVLGFGSSIMAECNRVEALISNRQKEDFLGSVSHELRSPLHGVLAAAELLQGTKFDDFQGSLLETINACGRTLLDTMNQVLDYTKLVSLQKDLRHLKRNLASQVDIKSMQRSAGHLDAYMATDISLLSEEVVEGICLGHSYGQRPTVSIDATGAPLVTSKPSQDPNIPQLHVDVTMDIAQHDWIYFTPPGAIRRIIMNIFSNAVKYTESGRVSMTLEAKETSEIWSAQQGPKEDLITLTVSDTGRGMSAEFLQSKLFVPFAQENSLSVGTGLGLSIVRSLVKSLNGSINVESHSGEGTTVKVTLPLSRQRQEDHGSIPGALPSPPQEDSDFSTNEVHLLRSTRAGQKVAILGIEPSDARKHLLWGTISHYLVDWYGLELVSPSSESPIDVILTNEQRPKEVDNWGSTDPNQAVLVVSDKYTGHDAIREEWSPFTKVVSIISRPCGPHKLARFLQKCFNRDSSSSNPESMVSPEPEQNPLSMTVENTSSTEQTSLVNDIQTSNTNNGAPIPHNTAVQSSTEKVDSLPPPATTHNTEDRPEPRKPRVLVVEDNKINLHLMLSFLKKRELVTLDSAENGQLAVKAVESLQQGYDIIFMDISMPVMNGFDATRSIRALEKHRDPNTPSPIIVALTGLSGSNDEREALDAGIDLFLTKPVTFKNVSKILDQWSERSPQDD